VSPTRARYRVVVDGSNLATEGRTTPSLAQLDEAVRAFLDENPRAEAIVVADATFEHRVGEAERTRFKDAELAGEIVTPPAGAIGRGDAFILKIADRVDAVVLSNDSFQEFQEEYPWLFDEGRLVGGKPVPGVGWVFTPRLPVRGVKSPRAKKVTAPTTAPPTPAIGTTLTPTKAAKTTKAAAKTAPKPPRVPAKAQAKAPVKEAKVAKATAKVAKAPAKAPEKVAKKPAARVAKVKAPPVPVVEPAVALRRGRQPVNPQAEFATFVAEHRVRSHVTGEVVAFTSHGAIIAVSVGTGARVECYAPTTSLGTPPPARARDALKRGDQRTFRLVSVDKDRRIAELALV
jgi:hypothetical protein